MIPILYESNEISFETNGLGRLRDCIRCEVTEERNSIFEVEFDYPINGSHFADIIPGRIIVISHDKTGATEPFDIYAFSRPLNGIVTFHARHISYRLNYCTAILSNINNLGDLFFRLNGYYPSLLKPDNGGFTFLTDKTSVGYMSAADGLPHTIRQLMGGIEGSILDTYGGEWQFTRFRVDLWEARGQQRDFTIRYGVNLIEYNEDLDYNGTYNAVVPFWSGNDEILVGGMVTNNLQSFDGRTDCVPLDLSDKWENKPSSVSAMENAARTWLSANKPHLPSQNIKINFVNLSDTEEYKQFAPLQTYGLCDQIKVVFPFYGVETYYKIVKVVWDVLEERYIEMELGNLSTSMAEALGVSNSNGNTVGASELSLTKGTGVDTLTNYSMKAGKVAVISGYFKIGNSGLSAGATIATMAENVTKRTEGIAWIGQTVYPIHIPGNSGNIAVSNTAIPYTSGNVFFKVTAVIS